jgi:hypothetical protein
VTERAFDWEDQDDWNGLDLAEKAAMLKSTVTMTEVVELCGHDVTKDKVRPPWNPTERTPSTHLYEDHFFDYGSGKHGDIFDWIVEEHIAAGEEPPSLAKSIKYLRTLALKGGKEPGDVETQPVRTLENLIWEMPEEPVTRLLDLDVTWFNLRRGSDGTIYVPHFEPQAPKGTPELVYGIKLRFPDGRKGSVPGSQFTHRLYHPYGWRFLHRGATAMIVEGESDSWAMVSTGMPNDLGVDVFALPSGASAWKDQWLQDLEPYSQILLCFDNDKAGKQALDKVTRKIGFDRAKELRVPQLYNDVREAVKAGWEPSL